MSLLMCLGRSWTASCRATTAGSASGSASAVRMANRTRSSWIWAEESTNTGLPLFRRETPPVVERTLELTFSKRAILKQGQALHPESRPTACRRVRPSPWTARACLEPDEVAFVARQSKGAGGPPLDHPPFGRGRRPRKGPCAFVPTVFTATGSMPLDPGAKAAPSTCSASKARGRPRLALVQAPDLLVLGHCLDRLHSLEVCDCSGHLPPIRQTLRRVGSGCLHSFGQEERVFWNAVPKGQARSHCGQHAPASIEVCAPHERSRRNRSG